MCVSQAKPWGGFSREALAPHVQAAEVAAFTRACNKAAQRCMVCPGPTASVFASSNHELPAGAESAGTGQMPLG